MFMVTDCVAFWKRFVSAIGVKGILAGAKTNALFVVVVAYEA